MTELVLKKALHILIAAPVCFFAGYQFALHDHTHELAPRQENVAVPIKPSFEAEAQLQASAPPTQAASQLVKSTTTESANHVGTKAFSDQLIDDDLDAMLINLEALRLQEGGQQAVATQYDLLKANLLNNAENIELMVSMLDQYTLEDESFDTVLAVLHTLPSEKKDTVLSEFAEQYVGASDKASQEKLLAVLSNRSGPIESDRIVQSLVDLAIVEQADTITRLRALNLVSPHQLQAAQKADISRELNQLVLEADGQLAARIVPEIIRFSKPDERPQIAGQLLAGTNTESVRSAVLGDISSGSISKSDDLKTILFNIATDPDDALSGEAASTLKYAFELDGSEYARLGAGQRK